MTIYTGTHVSDLEDQGAQAARKTPLGGWADQDLRIISKRGNDRWKVRAARRRVQEAREAAAPKPTPRADTRPLARRRAALPGDVASVGAVVAALVFGSIVLNYALGLLFG